MSETPAARKSPATLDEVARILLAARPHSLFEEADRFDARRRAFADMAMDFDIAMRRLDEGWVRPEGLGAISTSGTRPAMIIAVLQELQSTDFATSLRRAGDALLDGQRQVRELLAARDAAPAEERAAFDHRGVAAMYVVDQAFVGAGTDLPKPPERTATGEPLQARQLPEAPRIEPPQGGVGLMAVQSSDDGDSPASGGAGGGGGGGGGAPMGAMPMPMAAGAAGMGAAAGVGAAAGMGGMGGMGGMAGAGAGAVGGAQAQTRTRGGGGGKPAPIAEVEAWLEAKEREGWDVPGRR